MVTKYSFGTHDIWCEDHPLKVMFLDFYACSIARDASVYSVLVSQIDGGVVVLECQISWTLMIRSWKSSLLKYHKERGL